MSPTELGYYINLFKNKAAVEAAHLNIEEIYQKARITLRFLMKDLLLSDQFYRLDQEYQLG